MNAAKHQLILSLRVFLAHYRYHPFQAGAILLGIALAVSLFTGIKITNENARNSYQQTSELLSVPATASLVPAAGHKYLNETQYFKLRQHGIDALAVLSGIAYDQNKKPLKIQGSDLVAAFTAIKHTQEANQNLKINHQLPLGRLLAGEPLVIMSKAYQQKLAIDDVIYLNSRKFDVIVLNDHRLGQHLLMDISAAQILLDQPEKLSYIAFFADFEQLSARIKSQNLIIDNNQLQQSDNGAELTSLTQSFHLNLEAISMLAYLVGLFIAYNGVRYSLIKRQKILIKLMQFGVSRRFLMTALLIELGLLVHIGTLLGFFFGMQLSHWLMPFVQVTLEQLYLARIFATGWQLAWLMEALVMTMAVSLLACIPLYRTLVKQTLSQNSTQIGKQSFDNKNQNRLFILGLLGANLSIYMIFSATQIQTTMAFTGLLVLFVTLLVPMLLKLSLSLCQRCSRHTLFRYLIADSCELITPLSLAMMALFIALSSNLAMNTLTASFNQTLVKWLDVVLDGDLYIRPNHQNLDEIDAVLKADENVLKINYQWETQSRYFPLNKLSQTISLLARDNLVAVESTMFKNKALEYLSSFYKGNSVFISEPMAYKNNLKLGDKVIISALKNVFPDGVKVSAIYFDYGNPYGEVMISEKLWHQLGLPHSARNLAVIYQGDISSLENRLMEQANLTDQNIYRAREIKKSAINSLSRTFAITGVMGDLTLLVAAIGLFSAYMMIIQSRETNIARLYALGVSKPVLFLLINIQMLVLVLIVLLVAMPFGAFMGWILTHKTILNSFGWTLETIWPWHIFIKAGLVAIMAAFLALIYPLFRQAKRPVINSLQREVL